MGSAPRVRGLGVRPRRVSSLVIAAPHRWTELVVPLDLSGSVRRPEVLASSAVGAFALSVITAEGAS